MAQQIFQVDAFTREPFTGNPAAVCILPAGSTEERFQEIAREMNLAETAFVAPRGEEFGLRWFTPSVEVDLCGHATLASAHVLWESGLLPQDREARFQTLSGLLVARRAGDRIELDFPAEPPEESLPPAGLLEALGIETAVFVGRNRLDHLIEVENEEVVRAISPDFRRLAGVAGRGAIVTAPSADSRFDFVSRYFAPAVGVDEDPVTGSTHCCLGPWWSERLGKGVLSAWQASPRGGALEVEPRGERVLIRGQAVTVLRCELLV
ncbi:MAG: PhzF family phenazine biosynthesis protein [Acidobacteria bacterium]|nr:PhzF family phenazine biosynthesis protein [Acidobacteriota bacterium]